MSDAVLELSAPSADDIIAITSEVWSSFLRLELNAVPPQTAVLSGAVMTARVEVSGAWEGAVQLECPHAHAAAAGSLMFALERSALLEEQTRDALGELANIVAGNLKSLLPAPSALSIPAVSPRGGVADVQPGEAALVHRVGFLSEVGSLHVTVWKV